MLGKGLNVLYYDIRRSILAFNLFISNVILFHIFLQAKSMLRFLITIGAIYKLVLWYVPRTIQIELDRIWYTMSYLLLHSLN